MAHGQVVLLWKGAWLVISRGREIALWEGSEGSAEFPEGKPLWGWQPTDRLTDRLWAAEQALRCTDVQAVLVWLEKAASLALRRLHTLAQAHSRLLFVCRPQAADQEASPAPLRLRLQWSSAIPGAAAVLQVEVLKRRGPPLSAPLLLQTSPAALQQLLAAGHAQARRRRRSVQRSASPQEAPDAVDRAASLA